MPQQSEREYDAHREGRTWRHVRAGERVQINGVAWEILKRDVIAPSVIEFKIRNTKTGETKTGRPKPDSIADIVNPMPNAASALLQVRLGATVLADARDVKRQDGTTVREWMCPAFADFDRASRDHHMLTFHDVYTGETDDETTNLVELHHETGSVVDHAHR